jgi:hypothetical protein
VNNVRVHHVGVGQDNFLLYRVVPSALPAAGLMVPAAAKGQVVFCVLSAISGAQLCPEGPTTHTLQSTDSWHQGTPAEHRAACRVLAQPTPRCHIGWHTVDALGRADFPLVYAGVKTAIKVVYLPPPPISDRGGKERSVPTAAIVGGVGGLIALTAVAGAVILLIKRNKGNSKGKVATPTRSHLTVTPPHSQPCGTPPTIDHAGQNGSTSGNGPSVRPENFVTGELLGNYGRAPADTVSVTYIDGEHRHAVTTRTGFNWLASSDISTLNESSSPAEILNAQLDYITEARGGMISRFFKCATLLA